MNCELTAQPIHNDGTVGFKENDLLFVYGTNVQDVFNDMANNIAEYKEHTSWDLTLLITPKSQ